MSYEQPGLNRLRLRWNPQTQMWDVLSPDGMLLQSFHDKAEAYVYTSKNKDYVRRVPLEDDRATRIADEEADNSMWYAYGLFLLIGLPTPIGILLVLLIFIAVMGVGLPFISDVFGITLLSMRGDGRTTIADIFALFALGFLALMSLGALFSLLVHTFLKPGSWFGPLVVTPLYFITWYGVALGTTIGIITMIPGILGLFGFDFFGSLLFTLLWVLANYVLSRILWNIREHILDESN